MPASPILTGSHKRRVDRHHQLCLPLSWSQGSPQPWILSPPGLTRADSHRSSPLCLIPFGLRQEDDRLLASRRRERKIEAAKTCLRRLHTQARKRGLEPNLVTLVQTTPTSRHFPLTPAQFDWLGLKRDRTILFIGSITSVWIYPPPVWDGIVSSLSNGAQKRARGGYRNQSFDTPDSYKK